MSVNYTTSLVYGAAVKMKQIPVSVTRYNEITGEPYEKTFNRYTYVVEGTDIVFPQNTFSDELEEKLEDHQNMSLGHQNGYFGIPLMAVDPTCEELATTTADAVAVAEQAFKQLVADTFPEDPAMRNALLSNGKLILASITW